MTEEPDDTDLSAKDIEELMESGTPVEVNVPRDCTCDLSGPDPDCPQHGVAMMRLSEGVVPDINQFSDEVLEQMNKVRDNE